MQTCDVLVVGGGPAGSTCAWKLHAAGLDVLLLDKATFPRDKLCAGWITPAVLKELQIDREHYARRRVLQPLTAFRTGLIGGPLIQTDYAAPVSFGIRRCEFDDYLLRRSGARLQLGTRVETIRRAANGWVVNDSLQAPLLIGAGGHFCPVARLLGCNGNPAGPVVAAQEIEFELSDGQKADCPVRPEVPEIYFCDDLMGYGWCVRKGDFLNVGLGREDRRRLPRHAADFCDYLKREGRIPRQLPGRFRGHAYLLNEHSRRPLFGDGVVLVGDSAGLAYGQSGEGIRPAVESALMAAGAILQSGGDYRRERLQGYAQRLIRRLGRRHVAGPATGRFRRGLRQAIGRRLLASRWFARHVLLDRWFLHAGEEPLGRAE